ncbi:glycoside hydrolase superfamily [Massariosphaeria phaeospora]|uniref:Beta-mannosidase B n=1 Tax=Massariosphaeria phaeospora TaxID=100035 RepID=A0A7C8M6K1_9PLEO|nr:glycoside hydrolase superfamily [Massariosphaeria phaeospora]
MASSITSVTLQEGWRFKQGGRSSTALLLPANDVPTEIYRDLLLNGKIADPFQNMNELSVRWVADETWTYSHEFETPAAIRGENMNTMLVFEGLDTYASVYLNGELILEADNMFVAHRVDVTTLLQVDPSQKNALEIVFDSARQKGLELVKEHKEHRFIVHQTEISRGPVRKAQYHWGWDWGPLLITCGPWKPVRLETYTVRLADVTIEYELSDDLKIAKGKLHVRVEGWGSDQLLLGFTIGKTEYWDEVQDVLKDGVLTMDFELDVDLWWPRGYGSQSLYQTRVYLETTDGTPLDEKNITTGFRKVELIQEPDANGTSFYFRINNVDIFSGGSCWIPADSFLTQLTAEKYRDWMKLAAEGNQTMVRVWGGGIYEPDAFYAAADEFGVLIWQDFMFACANHPAHQSYLVSIETEARQNVRRLRDHPSVVIWAGNNEDYQIVERYGLEYRFEQDKDPQSWLKTDFPARYIYEYLLPKIVNEETKGVPYHPSSPFGNGTSTTLKVDPTVGDIHQWNVWHGTMEPYQKLPDLGGRFVSEFGMEAYPHTETLEQCITRADDRIPGSMAMDFRNKAIGHERRLVSYVAENFTLRYDLPGFAHLTQVMQADALGWAYQAWRRQWGAQGQRKCGGVLVWQLNDCWPTMSWAVVDYYLVPKPAYYVMRRAMEPVTVSVQRKFRPWTVRPADALWQRDTSHIDMRAIWKDVEFDVWVASNKREELHGEVIVKFISIRSGKELSAPLVKPVKIAPNGTSDVLQNHTFQLPHLEDDKTPFDLSKVDPFVISATLSIDGNEVASDTSWPDPIKYLTFPDRGVEVKYSDDGARAFVSARRPVKGFVFSEKQGVKLSDNGFDVLPGRMREVAVEGIEAEQLQWMYVGM